MRLGGGQVKPHHEQEGCCRAALWPEFFGKLSLSDPCRGETLTDPANERHRPPNVPAEDPSVAASMSEKSSSIRGQRGNADDSCWSCQPEANRPAFGAVSAHRQETTVQAPCLPGKQDDLYKYRKSA